VSEEQIVIKEDESVQAEECLYANSAINVVNFEGYVEKRMAQIETLSTEYDVSIHQLLTLTVCAFIVVNYLF